MHQGHEAAFHVFGAAADDPGARPLRRCRLPDRDSVGVTIEQQGPFSAFPAALDQDVDIGAARLYFLYFDGEAFAVQQIRQKGAARSFVAGFALDLHEVEGVAGNGFRIDVLQSLSRIHAFLLLWGADFFCRWLGRYPVQ